jgi:5-methylcytosine-specific restriction endonuclease McrA
MPDATLRFCRTRTPPCPNKLRGTGYCPDCQKAHGAAKRFTLDPRYGTQRWRRYSRNRLAQHPWCAECHTLLMPGDGVTDHIIPVVERPDLFWDEHNHRSLCHGCNKRRAQPFGRQPSARPA